MAAAGIINLYSAASSFTKTGTPVYLKQLYYFGMGLGVMLAVAMVGYHRLASLAYPLYILPGSVLDRGAYVRQGGGRLPALAGPGAFGGAAV